MIRMKRICPQLGGRLRNARLGYRQDTNKRRIIAVSYGPLRFFHPHLNFETFQNLHADPSDRIQTVSDSAD